MTGQVSAELAVEGKDFLALNPDEAEAVEDARWWLVQDLRFEGVGRQALEAITWDFACQAALDRTKSHVDDFVAKHAQEPAELTCYLAVELLSVPREVELHGVRLLPPESADRPATFMQPGPPPTFDSVIAVECTGTSGRAMYRRAHEAAEYALRLLRAGLREHRSLNERQLRFRLGTSYWFSGHPLAGWKSRGTEGSGIELTEELFKVAMSPPIATLTLDAQPDVEKRANRALWWFERAQLEVDPTLKILHSFSALEAMFGDSDPGLKADKLAIRRALLSEKLDEGFRHPMHVWLLYDRVRSAAVHGEEIPLVDPAEVVKFEWDVRRAINEFLAFARREGFSRRSQVRAALDSDPRWRDVEAFLEG